VSNETRNHIALESNYYDWRAIRRDKVQQKCNIVPIKFYGTYDPRKFCDWIAHLDYYIDLYEFSDASRVRFAKWKIKSSALDY